MNQREMLRLCWCLLLMVSSISTVYGLCLGSTPQVCLEELEEDEVMERLNYVLGKYEQVELKITGEPINVSGKRIYTESTEEVHVDFRYKDNTEHDVIQVCSFVVSNKIGDCEFISTTCNSFLARTPRPILMRKVLRICDGGVEIYEEPEEEEDEQPAAPIDDIDETMTETVTATGSDASTREQESVEER